MLNKLQLSEPVPISNKFSLQLSGHNYNDTLETICSTFVIEVSKINREVQLHETVN